MTENACLIEGCDGKLDFATGISSSINNQPLRSHVACPVCGTKQYLTETGIQGIQRPAGPTGRSSEMP